MKKSEFVTKCAELCSDWDVYPDSVCPPDGFGCFRLDKIDNGFTKTFGDSQTEESWNKTYFPALINSTIDEINRMFTDAKIKMHIVTFHNKISILNADYEYLWSVNNITGVTIQEKRRVLNRFFKLSEV